ncbi:DUF421 domain-containing protein [Sediminibacillus massiliensis]|uniref:DUF421 domain-containing protein n=1 Tax=Sediminibacillus massiliensis TaxID=1926277 RepID=UPI0009888BE0|nr:DUF421 domain-containing protein [Sediminibacillus massiliensis]
MEMLKDLLLVIGRIITILPLLLIVTLIMGKRAIGELPVFDFLIVIVLGAVVGADIADPAIHHIPTFVAILTITLLQRTVAYWKLSHRKLGKWITFEPTIVIQDGKLQRAKLKKIRYSIDNVLQMLREKNVFDISEVETAIIEANGSLSVIKKPEKNTVTREDMAISHTNSTITFPVIVEGKVYESVLERFQLDKTWLDKQLETQNILLDSVFYASINKDKQLHISLIDEQTSLPPIVH